MKKLALLLLWIASPTWAGYNATITSSAYTSCLAGRVSPGCYLTVGMAINAACNYAIVVKAIDSTAHTFQAFAQGNQSQLFSGTYATCTAVAAGYTQPPMTNGAVDPAVIEGGISTGSGGMDVAELVELFGWDEQAFTTVFQAGLLLFGTGLGIGFLISVVRKLKA